MCELCLPVNVSRRTLLVGAAATLAGWTWGRGATVSGAAEPLAIDDQVSIWPRQAWAGGDRPPRAEMPREDVRFLLVHHTAGANGYDEVGALEQMQAAYDHHVFNKGWPDVAYNFFIDRFGRVFEARAGSLAGPVVADATGGSQGFAQLVCLLGDFTNEMPTDAAIGSLVSVLAWLAGRDGIAVGSDAFVSFTSRGSNLHPVGATVTTNTITGHRSMSQTACPGDRFAPYVESDLPGAVQNRRSDGVGSSSTTVVETSVGSAVAGGAGGADLSPVEPSASTTAANEIKVEGRAEGAPLAEAEPALRVDPTPPATQSAQTATAESFGPQPAATDPISGDPPGYRPPWMPLGAVALAAGTAVVLRARTRRPDDEAEPE